MKTASELGRRVLVLVGRTLVVVSLPIAFIIAGAALRRDGSFLEGGFVFFLCFIPVAVGIALAELGQRGYWQQVVSLGSWLWSSVSVGLAVALISLTMMYAIPMIATLVALVALCGFAVLDPVLNVTRRSWWGGALLSIIVWIVLLSALAGAADSLQHLGDDTMIFLVPFMVYPVALGVSGLLRLTGGARGWPVKKTAGIAAAVVVLGFASYIGLQLTFAIVPAAIEQITGNTLPNTVLSGQDGKVVAAESGRVDVQEQGQAPVLYRLTPETQFDLRGPGRGNPGPPAGPSWLQPGQRVNIEYVYRHRERQARLVAIWVEDKP